MIWMWVICLQIYPRTGDTMNEKSIIMYLRKTNHERKVINSFNMQSEITALQGAIHDLSNELKARAWKNKKIST